MWVGSLDDASLRGFIAGDSGPCVSAVAITTLDGRAAVGGTSGGLGNPADAALLQALGSPIPPGNSSKYSCINRERRKYNI